ncbi:GntR family transcriptional regulator [Streptomyces zhihengii]|uniref:GntR family transcriptional regulator n=1 Tax=Streptomyces zhihengii TaxID=1818004 RepID=UPI00363F0E2C
MNNSLPPERTALYRLFDADGRLLYIGISNNPEYRFNQHRRDKPWWPLVARNEVTWFDSLPDAAAAEKVAIKAESPAHNHSENSVKVTRTSPLRGRTGYRQIADDLRRAILDGHFAPGAKLPSHHELMRDYDVAASTVRQALGVLKTENLITTRQGAGSLVRDLDGNRTIAVAIDQPREAAALLAKYMAPGHLAELAEALAELVRQRR